MQENQETINILFLGGAKRVSLARKLIDAGADMGLRVNIYSYELTSRVPIASVGMVIVGRRWDDPELYAHLHEVVIAAEISVMIPFFDAAVVATGKYISLYGDVWAPVMKPHLAESFYDKTISAVLFEENNLPIPATYKSGRPHFPLIAKPRYGTGGKGIMIINDVNSFRRVLRHKEEYLLQQYFSNIEEYTVDCYIPQRGKAVCISPRRRLEVLGGEVSRTVTVDSPEIVEASARAIERLRLRGAVTLQFLRDLDSGELMLMEIDPRLGGGVVCSIHAGAEIPRHILDEARGIQPRQHKKIKPGVLICRYFDEAVFNV